MSTSHPCADARAGAFEQFLMRVDPGESANPSGFVELLVEPTAATKFEHPSPCQRYDFAAAPLDPFLAASAGN
jgi:hypothetical protein